MANTKTNRGWFTHENAAKMGSLGGRASSASRKKTASGTQLRRSSEMDAVAKKAA